MSSIGTGAMTLSAEDYQEREEKGFSYSLLHACDCGCYSTRVEVSFVLPRRPVLMSPDPSGDGLYSWL